jgi:hypothetical protein
MSEIGSKFRIVSMFVVVDMVYIHTKFYMSKFLQFISFCMQPEAK